MHCMIGIYAFNGRTKKKEEIKQGKDLSNNSAKIKKENNPVQDKEEDIRLQSFRPKWRH